MKGNFFVKLSLDCGNPFINFRRLPNDRRVGVEYEGKNGAKDVGVAWIEEIAAQEFENGNE